MFLFLFLFLLSMVCVVDAAKSGMNTIRAYRIHVPTYYLHCELGRYA